MGQFSNSVATPSRTNEVKVTPPPAWFFKNTMKNMENVKMQVDISLRLAPSVKDEVYVITAKSLLQERKWRITT